MPNVITEGLYTGEFMVSEANGALSRLLSTALSGQVFKPGHVLGRTLVGASAAATAFVGNAGNGAMGSITVGGSAKRGDYKLVVIEPASNAGMFTLEDPDGITVKVTGDVATAFTGGGLSFTLADNTDFQAGDGFVIAVTGGAYKWKEWNPGNTDGSEVARGISYDHVDASAADKRAVIIARQAEVNTNALVWFTGATDEQKAAGLAQLAAPAVTIIGRS